MNDTEIKRRKAICEAAHVNEIDDVSDGFHTFRQLYYQRMMLFAAIVKQNKGKAWKSLRHEDGELCFGGGWFIVGIDTPEGSFTYHYEDNYFSLFDCEELERGKYWDGHTEKDVTRLLSLSLPQPELCEDAVSRQNVIDAARKVHDIFEGEYDTRTPYGVIFDVQDAVSKLPSVTPKSEPCDDAVSRQAAIDAVKAMEDKSGKGEIAGFYNLILERVIDKLNDLPSAQSEIIHCKDCIWYELPSHKISENCVRWMKSNGILLPIKPDDFCSRAERRTDERTD